MSKPRSRLFDYANREFRLVRGFTTAIHFGKQAKHLPGHPNHDITKSTITISFRELQTLLEYKAGTGEWRGINRETVDFQVTIGLYRNPRTGRTTSTTRGTIHYSKAGAHVVPARPHVGTGHEGRP